MSRQMKKKKRKKRNRPLHLQDRKAVKVHETKPVYPEGVGSDSSFIAFGS